MKARKIIILNLGSQGASQDMESESSAGVEALRVRYFMRHEDPHAVSVIELRWSFIERQRKKHEKARFINEESAGQIRAALNLSPPGSGKQEKPSSVPAPKEKAKPSPTPQPAPVPVSNSNDPGPSNSNLPLDVQVPAAASSSSVPEVGVYLYFHATTDGKAILPVNEEVLAGISAELREMIPSIRKICMVACNFAVATGVKNVETGLEPSRLALVCATAKLPGVMFAGWKKAVTTIVKTNTALPQFPEFPSSDRNPIYRDVITKETDIKKLTGHKAILNEDRDTGYEYLSPIGDEDRKTLKVIVKWSGGQVVAVPLGEWHDA